MTMTRRRFLGTTAAMGVAAAAAETLASHIAGTVPLAAAAGEPITPELIALNRMGFGPRPGDVAQIAALGGLDAYIDQQLDPLNIPDPVCDAKLAEARLRIRYDAGSSHPARNELLPLGYIGKTLSDPVPNPAPYFPVGMTLWELRNGSIDMGYTERMRPWEEVRVATWIRAIYSERQLQEVLVDFWHNHFNVNASSDSNISVDFPSYDMLMRQHCLGNFRDFVTGIAKSTSMLYYLDNYVNRAGGGEGGNENYARELIELHTLGSDNYLKFYDDRGQIGTITYNGETFARGYVDDDVYEAARCLTGWTVRNDHYEFPNTPEYTNGQFLYWHNWHDTYPKTVLAPSPLEGIAPAPNIPNNQPDMKDGLDVIHVLTSHIGTARFICTKLCRRLISDSPPASVIDAAVAEWMANRDAPDQLKKVVRVILRSNEFKNTWGQKVKRPFEFFVSYIRATGAQLRMVDDVHPDRSCWNNLSSRLNDTGHRLYEWGPPTGHPDLASFWLSTNGLLRRWNVPYSLARTGEYEINAQLDLFAMTTMSDTCIQIVDAWINRLFGYSVSTTTRDALIAFLAQGKPADQPPALLSGESSLKERLESMVHLMAMSPEFQLR